MKKAILIVLAFLFLSCIENSSAYSTRVKVTCVDDAGSVFYEGVHYGCKLAYGSGGLQCSRTSYGGVYDFQSVPDAQCIAVVIYSGK